MLFFSVVGGFAIHLGQNLEGSGGNPPQLIRVGQERAAPQQASLSSGLGPRPLLQGFLWPRSFVCSHSQVVPALVVAQGSPAVPGSHATHSAAQEKVKGQQKSWDGVSLASSGPGRCWAPTGNSHHIMTAERVTPCCPNSLSSPHTPARAQLSPPYSQAPGPPPPVFPQSRRTSL